MNNVVGPPVRDEDFFDREAENGVDGDRESTGWWFGNSKAIVGLDDEMPGG